MINVIALGSRGDVQPYAVLTRALQDAGYAVRLLATRNFAPFIASFGIDYVPLDGDVQALLHSAEGKALMKTRNPVTLAKGMSALAAPLARTATEQITAASQDTDMIIASATGAWLALNVCDALEIPMLFTLLQPMFAADEYFSCIAPQPPFALPGFINRASTNLSYTGFWLVVRPVLNQLRHELFGLPPMPRLGTQKPYLNAKTPILMAISEHVAPRARAWHKNIHLTGYWTMDDADTYTPPAALVDFLAAGPPPVYIGFGSMQNDDPAATADIALTALAQTGQRGILLTGWGGLDAAALPDTVYRLDATSHHWLLPQMAAVVHHGGAGTTAAALRSGRPSIVVPFFADQPFWADRVYRLGVGPRPIPRRKLTAATLSAAIDTALHTPDLVQRAALLGRQLNSENGTLRAVQLIEKHLP